MRIMRIMHRTEREFDTDAVMTLALLKLSKSEGPVGDRLKITKLMFLATYRLLTGRCKGLNFSFYRYTYGPFTTQVYETWEDLSWMGLLHVEPGPTGCISLTSDGQAMANRFLEEVLSTPENRLIREVLEGVAREFGGLSTDELLQRVYEMKVQPLGWQNAVPLRQLPIDTPLTTVLEPEKTQIELTIPERWLANLELWRRKAQAKGVPRLEKVYELITPEVLDSLDRALTLDNRGERKRVDWEEIKKTYGIG